MVRTQSPQFSFRIDTSRILALSTAIALHLLALSLLLIPLSRRAMPDPPAPITPRWQMPILVPTPPLPPMPIEKKQPPTVDPIVPVTSAPPVVPTTDVAIVESVATTAAPSAPSTDSLAAPESVSPALPGASLRYLQAPPPAYPRAALTGRQQGTVLLQVRVGVDGAPVEVVVAHSSGFRALDQAARQQVLKHWRFQPAMRDGQAVEALGLVPVAFSLAN